MAEHDALRVIASDWRVPRIHRFGESDRDRSGACRDIARGEEAGFARHLGRRRDHSPPRASPLRGGAPGEQGNADYDADWMCWHEKTIHCPISQWESPAAS